MPGLGFLIGGIVLLFFGMISVSIVVVGVWFIYIGKRKRNAGRFMGGVMSAAVGSYFLYVILGKPLESKDTRAHSWMALSQSARVLQTEEDNMGDYRVVLFAMPETKSKSEWLDEIFQANRKTIQDSNTASQVSRLVRSENERTLICDKDIMELTYDDVQHQYRFRISYGQ